jgi:hypothetical protein
MKLLFSQQNPFFLEQSGREIFNVEKKEIQKIAPGVQPKKFEQSTDKLESKIDQTQLSKSVEKEVKIKEGIEKGDKIFEDIKRTILKELPASMAQKMTPEAYGQNIDNIGKRFSARINNWNNDYNKIVPNGWQEQLKIAAVVGTVAYGSTDGGVFTRLKSASTWAAGAAVLSHPAILSGLAALAKGVGQEVIVPAVETIPNIIITMIDNPKSIWDAVVQTKNNKYQSVGKTPIYKLLTTGRTASHDLGKEISEGTQSTFELRAKGLSIGDENLRNVTNEMELYEEAKKRGESPKFPDKSIKGAATFILQMAEHKLNDKELAKFRVRLWNEEATPSEIRKVLATNAEREMLEFFKKDPTLWGKLKKEMNSLKSSTSALPKADLSKMFIDSTVSSGSAGFSLTGPKTGIRRFLSLGAGGMALAGYIISFLTVTTLMTLRRGIQPDFWKKTAPEIVKKPIKYGKGFLGALAGFVKRKQSRKLLKRYQGKNCFTEEEGKKLFKDLNKKDKEKLYSQTKDFIKREKKEGDKEFKFDQLPEILKSKLEKIRKEENA